MRLACSRALPSAGIRIAMRMAMIPMTTRSSTSVNAARFRLLNTGSPTRVNARRRERPRAAAETRALNPAGTGDMTTPRRRTLQRTAGHSRQQRRPNPGIPPACGLEPARRHRVNRPGEHDVIRDARRGRPERGRDGLRVAVHEHDVHLVLVPLEVE